MAVCVAEGLGELQRSAEEQEPTPDCADPLLQPEDSQEHVSSGTDEALAKLTRENEELRKQLEHKESFWRKVKTFDGRVDAKPVVPRPLDAQAAQGSATGAKGKDSQLQQLQGLYQAFQSAQEVSSLQMQLASADKAAAQQKLEVNERLAAVMAQLAAVEKRAHTMKVDLLAKLQAANTARDAAKAEVAVLQRENETLRDHLLRAITAATNAAAGTLSPIPQGISASATGPATPPTTSATASPQAGGVHAARPTAAASAPHRANSTPAAPKQRKSATCLDSNSPTSCLTPPPTRAADTQQTPPSMPRAHEAHVSRRTSAAGLPELPPSVSLASSRAGSVALRQEDEERGVGASPGAPPGEGSSGRAEPRDLPTRQTPSPSGKSRQLEDQLTAALALPLGFHMGRPVAAVLVFRCLLHWRALQADRTTLLDRIASVITTQVEGCIAQGNTHQAAYWLNNTVTLAYLFHKHVKVMSNPQHSKGKQPTPQAAVTGVPEVVEAKYNSLLFKQRLDKLVQRLHLMLFEHTKQQLSPLLASCAHAPKAHVAPGADTDTAGPARDSWQQVVVVLQHLLQTLQDNCTPHVLVQALYKQLFAYVNCELCNQLLLRRECCTFSNGQYVSSGLQQIEAWIQGQPGGSLGSSGQQLAQTKQAVSFLVLADKPKCSLSDIAEQLCAELSCEQLHRLATMYWDDQKNTPTISTEVMKQLKARMVDPGASFLLEEVSAGTVIAAEVLDGLDTQEYFKLLPMPDSLLEAAHAFAFLQQDLV